MFRITGQLLGEFTSDQWILLKQGPVMTFDDFFTISVKKLLNKLLVIWDAMALMWCHRTVDLKKYMTYKVPLSLGDAWNMRWNNWKQCVTDFMLHQIEYGSMEMNRRK